LHETWKSKLNAKAVGTYKHYSKLELGLRDIGSVSVLPSQSYRKHSTP